MALSKEAFKNLLDVMQKVSLAITAVSIGLLSTAILSSRGSTEKKAQPELKLLLSIRERIGAKSANEIVRDADTSGHRRAGGPSRMILEGKIGVGGEVWSNKFGFAYPARYLSEVDPKLGEQRFDQLQNLEEIRAFWNAIAQTKLWRLEEKPWDFVLNLGLEKTVGANVRWDGQPSSVGRDHQSLVSSPVRFLDRIGESSLYTDSNGNNRISFDYDFSPLVTSLGDSNRQMEIFRLEEKQRDLLKVVTFSVDVEAKPLYFSPALLLDPVLGKLPNFAFAFPNLNKLPDNYQNQRIGSLGTSLEEAVAQQPKGDLEVFGAKVPSELVALLGLPALATLLFQFASLGFYTASNVERLGQDEATQWSFLLKGWPFLLISIVAIFVFPAVASVCIFVSVSEENWSSEPIYLALTIIVLICSAVAFIAIRRLRLCVGETAQLPLGANQVKEVDDLSD
jgi:hypothetical protein